MNHLAIIRIFSLIGIVLSGVLLLCAALAIATDELVYAVAFAIAATGAGPLGGTILLLTDKPVQKSRAVDGLAVAILFWSLLPAICAIPFMPLMVGQGGFLGAYYEAVSCLTTTGHSIAVEQGAELPNSIILWRAVLHLLGAVAAITIAATVLSALNLGGPGIHRSRFFTIPEASFFDAIPRVMRMSFAITASAILAVTILLAVSGSRFELAFVDAVSVATTGLVDPSSHDRAPVNAFASLSLSAGLLVGTLGLIVMDHLSHREYAKAAADPEVVAFIGTAGIIAFLVFLAGLPVMPSLGWALSSLSTSGIALSDPERFDRIPVILMLLPVLIGGSALSAAGGIKLARLIVLSKRVSLEFTQLGYRGSVQMFRFRGRRQSEETVMGVWVYLVGYIIASALGVLLLSLAGQTFHDAMVTAIGSLSNAGHILAETLDPLSPIAQLGAILGMILGRLEVIALLPALNPDFWRR